MNKIVFSPAAKFRVLFLLIVLANLCWPKPSPELPGEEITESDIALKKSKYLTKPLNEKKSRKKNFWRAPPVDEQLARDKTLIGMGYGAVFLPSLTEERLEPEVQIYSLTGKRKESGQTGHRILLEQGEYQIRFGSGNLEQQMRYKIQIEEGHTTVLKPDWAGMVVETINTDDEYIRENYEVYRLGGATSFGKGYGRKEERLKDIRTWILEPGIYRITRVGENITSLTNYITVQLNPGELSIIQLVFDNESGSLIAGGIKDLRERKKAGTNWQYGVRAGGNFSWISKWLGGEETESSKTALADYKLRVKYDKTRYMGINILQGRNDFNKDKGEPFSPLIDEIKLRTTWIRRLTNSIGPYIQGKLYTHLFPKKETADKKTIFHSGNGNGNVFEKNQTYQFQTSFFPLEFSEGLGVNIELLTSYFFTFSTQLGAALNQDITYKQWAISETTDSTVILKPSKNNYEFGFENSINAIIRLGSRLSIDISSEIFFINGNPARYKIRDFTTDARLGLTRHLELSLTYKIVDQNKEVGSKSGKLSERFRQDIDLLIRVSMNL